MGGDNRKSSGGEQADGSGPAIVLGAVLDGIPESIVLGLGLLGGTGVSLAFIAAVFLSNLPEGVAGTTGLTAAGWAPRRVIGLWLLVTAVSAVASLAGYGLFDSAPATTVAFVLAFAGGAVLTMLADTMMPEAFEHGGRSVGLVTTAGFALAFALHLMDWTRSSGGQAVHVGDGVGADRRGAGPTDDHAGEVERVAGVDGDPLAVAGALRAALRPSMAAGSAYCSPLKPDTKRPPRTRPRSSNRRSAHWRSRHGTATPSWTARSRNTTPHRASSWSATTSARPSRSSTGSAAAHQGPPAGGGGRPPCAQPAAGERPGGTGGLAGPRPGPGWRRSRRR